MISTTTLVSLQTLRILCGSLHYHLKHYLILICPLNGLKSFLHAYWSLGDLILVPSHPNQSCTTIR